MPRSTWLETVAVFSLGLTACSFDGGDGNGSSASDCNFTFSRLCGLKLDAAKSYTTVMTVIDTSMDSACSKVVPADAATGSPALCVISGSTITIGAGATVRAIGSRPLVFAASGSIEVRGTLDASSTRAAVAPEPAATEALGAGAESVSCGAFARASIPAADGGSGGAGGSFAGAGGAGGDSATDATPHLGGLSNPALESTALTALRGGCRGQAGGGDGAGTGALGGPPGGTLYLASLSTIQIAPTGMLGANGGGGLGGAGVAGGSGGGAGGLIVLEAATMIAHNGIVSTNGGGGGEGGAGGFPGANGAIGIAAAPGGDASTPTGNGGAGGASSLAAAGTGSPSNDGGGGGGGGVGSIRFLAPRIIGSGKTSPPYR